MMAQVESTALRHRPRHRLGNRDPDPGIDRGGINRIPLHLKFEETARTQQSSHFPDVAFNDLEAGNMLEDPYGKSEVVGLPAPPTTLEGALNQILINRPVAIQLGWLPRSPAEWKGRDPREAVRKRRERLRRLATN